MSVVVGVLGAVLAAGCGGGGGEAVSSPPTPAPDPSRSADVQQLASVVSRCGVSRFEDFGATSINSGSFLATFGGHTQVVGYVASGDYFDTSVRMDLAIPETDFRATSLELGHQTHRMGVAINGPFLLGALACIKGTARMTVVDGRNEVSWFSDALSRLPVNRLPGVPVAGLEFFGNFHPGSPAVYFTLDAAVVSHTATMSLCRLEGTERWICEPVQGIFNGLTHTFSSPVAGHGVYVLTELHESAQ
ncbi:MAG: hypothetical protein MUF44_10965 [Hydrogenophaga sp.]|nr:hypothetical protein [Hydrogenophaga sp.]